MAARKPAAKKPAAKRTGKKPIGKPPYRWTQEIEDEIFKRIAEGESLKGICSNDWLPSVQTVRKRVIEDAEFADRYARAREAQADHIFEEILRIADDATNDMIDDGEGGKRLDTEHVQRSKLRIEARKWMAGKLRPKVYGDKIDVNASGVIKVEGVNVNFVGDEGGQ